MADSKDQFLVQQFEFTPSVRIFEDQHTDIFLEYHSGPIFPRSCSFRILPFGYPQSVFGIVIFGLHLIFN